MAVSTPRRWCRRYVFPSILAFFTHAPALPPTSMPSFGCAYGRLTDIESTTGSPRAADKTREPHPRSQARTTRERRLPERSRRAHRATKWPRAVRSRGRLGRPARRRRSFVLEPRAGGRWRDWWLEQQPGADGRWCDWRVGEQSSGGGWGWWWMGQPVQYYSLGCRSRKWGWWGWRLWRLGQSFRTGLGITFGASQRVERWLVEGARIFMCVFDVL